MNIVITFTVIPCTELTSEVHTYVSSLASSHVSSDLVFRFSDGSSIFLLFLIRTAKLRTPKYTGIYRTVSCVLRK
jgi:hypothetical protein